MVRLPDRGVVLGATVFSVLQDREPGCFGNINSLPEGNVGNPNAHGATGGDRPVSPSLRRVAAGAEGRPESGQVADWTRTWRTWAARAIAIQTREARTHATYHRLDGLLTLESEHWYGPGTIQTGTVVRRD